MRMVISALRAESFCALKSCSDLELRVFADQTAQIADGAFKITHLHVTLGDAHGDFGFAGRKLLRLEELFRSGTEGIRGSNRADRGWRVQNHPSSRNTR